MSLKGKYALITGCSRGIGRGIALKLAQEGANVAVHYFQNRAAAEKTLAEVRTNGADGFLLQADVSRADEVSGMFNVVKENFGQLDIFVSNARCEVPTFYQSPMEISLEHWDMAHDSQGKAFLIGARESANLMSEGGRILALTYSGGSRTGSWQPWVAMGSAKAALESLVRYFAVALAKRRITVNALSPGFTEDSVLNSLPEIAQDMVRNWHKDWTPMGRLGTPADIGKIAAFMCSEEAGWITGQVIYTDGGASLMNPEVPLALQQP
ncbi:MAG: SDR family oxidoreductase [Pyrinomonadaceae bacterium]